MAWGAACGDANYPDVHGRVIEALPWIKQITGKLISTTIYTPIFKKHMPGIQLENSSFGLILIIRFVRYIFRSDTRVAYRHYTRRQITKIFKQKEKSKQEKHE